MSKTIVIAERDNIACVLDENSKVSEFFVHRGEILLNDVYLAKVENILPSIEAAFVDVGSTRMGFLHTDDIIGKGSLKDKIAPKSKLLVQVVKEPTGHKGPRVTTSISLPGRFLVLMPLESGINVSKKIESNKERARLKSIVSLMKPVGVGIIIRTEAENQSEADIQDDLDALLEKWNTIVTSAENYEAPALLYRDQDLLYRVIREACTEDIGEIIVDTSFAYQRALQLLQTWNMDKKITFYKGTEPLLIYKNIDKEIKLALQTKVNLKNGGYLFIQSTEALTVIDVNSGKFTSSSTQDETIYKTNVESAYEIARQLKLRNIGGIVVIDFIDMTRRSDKIKILEELELAVADDKAKPQIGQLSDFGLVELTRHRQGQSIQEMFSVKCSNCNGTGYILKELNFAQPNSQDNTYQSKFARVKFPRNQKSNKNRNNNKPLNEEKNKHLFDKEEIDTPQTNKISIKADNELQKDIISTIEKEIIEDKNIENLTISKNTDSNEDRHLKNNTNKKNKYNKREKKVQEIISNKDSLKENVEEVKVEEEIKSNENSKLIDNNVPIEDQKSEEKIVENRIEDSLQKETKVVEVIEGIKESTSVEPKSEEESSEIKETDTESNVKKRKSSRKVSGTKSSKTKEKKATTEGTKVRKTRSKKKEIEITEDKKENTPKEENEINENNTEQQTM